MVSKTVSNICHYLVRNSSTTKISLMSVMIIECSSIYWADTYRNGY